MPTARKIIRRTRGTSHGLLTRLMSPSDIGQVLKPFVFLDHFNLNGSAGGTDLHPHSGIATVTYLFDGTIRYEDSNGSRGVVSEGGLEWFKAAGGAWHSGGAGPTGRARGFQLWLALRAAQELDPPENIYLSVEQVPRDGPARVLVGAYGDARSLLNAGAPVNYLAVRLSAGDSWQYKPPIEHTVGWLAVSAGRLRVPEPVEWGELAILEPSDETIDVIAESDAEFVLGSAVPHPHELALGMYSVHTNAASLKTGERRLMEIQRQLEHSGRL